MASNARTGIGAQFQRGDGATPEVFAKIAEVRSIKGPSQKKDQIEVTNLDSTGGYGEFIPGFKDGGEVSLECNFVPTDATYQLIESDFATQTGSRNYRIQFPDGTKYTFPGFISGLDNNIPAKEAIGVTVTVKVTGPVVRS